MRWLAVAFLVAFPASGQDPFEAVLLSHGVYGCYILPIQTPSTLLWVTPERFEPNTDVVSLASADGRTVFALVDAAPVRIAKISPGGFRTEFFSGSSESIAQYIGVAPDGRVFVASWQEVTSISPAGVKERTSPIPDFQTYGGYFAVAPDGCTLFYSSRTANVVRRINGCTGEVLPNFASPASYVLDVHPLSDGSVLVAEEDTVSLYDAAGVLIRVVARMDSYGVDLQGLYPQRIAVSRDGADLWLAAMPICDGQSILLRLSMTNGRELSRLEIGGTWATALVAGVSHPSTPAIPTTTHPVLLLLAVTLASAGLFVLRR